jgi:hypothetical protein
MGECEKDNIHHDQKLLDNRDSLDLNLNLDSTHDQISQTFQHVVLKHEALSRQSV